MTNDLLLLSDGERLRGGFADRLLGALEPFCSPLDRAPLKGRFVLGESNSSTNKNQ